MYNITSMRRWTKNTVSSNILANHKNTPLCFAPQCGCLEMGQNGENRSKLVNGTKRQNMRRIATKILRSDAV